MTDEPITPGDLPVFSNRLTVTGVRPDSGPASGGNVAIVRGSGFTADALVFVDDRLVQPADTILVDKSSLQIVLPAGEVGPADVRVLVADEEARRAEAYHYNPLLLEPDNGSIAGGTRVTITSSDPVLRGEPEVTFGDAACTNVELITPSVLRCTTPPASVGYADVRVSVEDEEEPAGEPQVLEARDAFEYVDLTDTDHGGIGGGPIEGTLNVTVIEGFSGLVVPGALVLVGNSLEGEYQGRTDARGQITFSGDDLRGPITVHVAAKCMERASIVSFDARNITVYVDAILDPTCGMPGEPGGGTGRGTAGAFISGELLFPGSNEFLLSDWDSVPEPRDNEERVAYVFTTRVQVGVANPAPEASLSLARIVESGELGARGYPYRIFARPAGLAVYAVSGLERRDTGEFVPYLMGVARDVLTAPNQETTGVDITMNIPLDQELQVSLAKLPAQAPRGPDLFRVQAHVDLGGEGVIVRQIKGEVLDRVTSYSGGALFRFFAQPALLGGLRDARYQVIAGYYSSEREDASPYSEVRKLGLLPSIEPIVIADMLSIPATTAPKEGGRLPTDRRLRWSIEGTAPDLWMIEIVGGDNFPAWSQLVPGSLSESPIPDFSPLEDLDDIAPGVIRWSVRAVRIDGFVFDDLKYNQLSSRFWSHTSVDTFTMQR